MTVRRTLLEMLRELRIEIGMDPDVNLHAHANDAHRSLLQRVQRLLYDNEEWPHLVGKFSVDVSALASSFALPDDLSSSAINHVYVLDMDATFARPYQIKHGWNPEELVHTDPTSASWPIQRWQLEADTDPDVGNFDRTVTFWPRPDRDCRFIIYGRRALSPFVDDGDRATLDSDLIVLQAAAEILAQQQAPDAQLKASAAGRRKENLLARQRGDVANTGSMVRW